ncbi:hypothetical protein [Dyadobacter fermentans]|uniref:hypothetical protein n=1 Tax=Dyadobacter fermentans TaxID=94254 RepID=UPI001CBE3F47|nr:hypothetical protein [Dyadobacter fermentans]MBZ1360415.1 hypothetical protein [Dyadobacter fermentans]
MIARLTWIAIVCLLNLQCKVPDKQTAPCDCQSKAGKKEIKNIEAVVVHRVGNQPPGGNQGPDQYILSTSPKDFGGASFSIGENLLVPRQDSLSVSADFRKPGIRVIVSYKRKECYGALTSPDMHGAYGYYIDLTAIQLKAP